MNVRHCVTCDAQGPDLPHTQAFVDFHRAAHDLWRVTVEPWALPVVAWLARRLKRTH